MQTVLKGQAYPAVEVGLQSGRGGEGLLQIVCLCESTAKILVLVLEAAGSGGPMLEDKLNEEQMRVIYMLAASASVPLCVCDELRIITAASLLPSNSCTVLGRGFWQL